MVILMKYYNAYYCFNLAKVKIWNLTFYRKKICDFLKARYLKINLIRTTKIKRTNLKGVFLKFDIIHSIIATNLIKLIRPIYSLIATFDTFNQQLKVLKNAE